MADSTISSATSDRDRDDVYVSEVATYAFCAKAWHLERVIRNRPTNESQVRRALGVDWHLAHGTRVERLRKVRPGLARWSILLLAIAVLFFALAVAIT